jgi:hypothetical protein
MTRTLTVTLLLLSLASRAAAAENLLVNGDLEQGLAGWDEFWSRTPGGRAVLDSQEKHGGRQSVRVEHTGSRDWSFSQSRRLPVRMGEIYRLSAWLKLAGAGSATISVTLYDAKGEVIDWSFGQQSTRATAAWRLLDGRFAIPPGAAAMLPRLIGDGPATVWLAEASLRRTGMVEGIGGRDLPEELTVGNGTIEATFHVADASLSLRDRRSGRTWRQRPGRSVVVLDARPEDHGFRLRLLEPASVLSFGCSVRLDSQRPEIVVELSGSGDLAGPVKFPPAWTTSRNSLLILPVNEGISYPAADASLDPMWYHLFGGHGLCMAWWGVTEGEQAIMALVETPDDAAVEVPRLDGLLTLAPQWLPQKGQFGPPRRIRYVLFDQGGYVAICQRYRRYAEEIGLLKTLAQKRKENPNVDRLVGAANVWSFDREAVSTCREMQALGIERILWSSAAQPEQIRQMNRLGVLSSRYDIYQDVMDPANFPKLRDVYPDWTTPAWPKDLMLDEHGDWIRGWEVDGRDGRRYPCGVLCDRQAVDYARRRIPAELATHPYLCRFIDTTTASPWRECYAPGHPVTRSESRRYKMDLLNFVSRDCRLVTGSETGHDAAVPFVHYFEGMMSLGPYRTADAGREMQQILDDVPQQIAKFQTGCFYRLPLWELVYHDCVVAYWYWGDYNNKLPAVWARRDLFNALYGTPPMYMFNGAFWRPNRQRFLTSYRTAAPVARATGYAAMVSHRWLTPDHAVQQTRFANGVVVTVNFGDRDYQLPDGKLLGPLSHWAQGPGL